MAATKRLASVPDHKPGWRLFVNGNPLPADTEWEAVSPFGSVRTAVVVDGDGKPVFDRPAYAEAPNVNIVAFGKEPDGTVRIGLIRQPRPHADDPEQPGVDGHAPIIFGQIPMGFQEKVIGETADQAAARETGEETGASHVIAVTAPAYPWHNPNPTFVSTWSELRFVEVDLAKIEALKPDRSEPIFSAEYVTIPELFRRIKSGKDEQGAVYRMCTANSILMVFFSHFPELLAGLNT